MAKTGRRFACLLALGAGWVLAFASGVSASSPELASITPRGAQRGSDVTLFFNGARLGDAREILLYDAGMQVTKLEKVNDNQVKVAIKIAADCRLGEHRMRLRAASGISELRTFFVSALPSIDEKEPNSDFNAPQKITLNVTVNGVVDNEDVDYFSFEAKKGQRVSAEIEGMRLGNTLFDPYIALLNNKRFELAAVDDSPLFGQDAAVSAVIPEDGAYVVEVRESAYGGNGACSYRLHIGTFPRPTAVFPPGGKKGEEIEVRFLGDPAGELRQKVKLPAADQAAFGLFAQDAGGIAPSPIPFRLSDHGNVNEVEPNNTHEQATRAELPGAMNGIISQAGDVDYFRFTAKKGQAYDVQCYARRLGSPLDPVMTISYFGGGVIAANDDSNGPDSYLRFTAPEDKEYVVGITDHLGQGGPTYVYRVEFTPVRAQLGLSIPKLGVFSQERQTIAVPRGNRYATLIAATRTDFGGELEIAGEGLPQGVTLNAEHIPANLDTVPVVFEARPDAPVAGNLANLVVSHVDPAQKISGSFHQTAELVIGNPGNSVYWRTAVDRAAVAVTEEVPFKINIIEPKVPLVQNGSMSLKVVAERKPGFKAPIVLQMLFNPPGIGSGGATIAEGQNEAVLPLNAAANAEVRKWKIAVLGNATVGNGPVWVSTQLATLEVAPPFVVFAMERAAAEQGKSTELFGKVQQLTPFKGPAKVHLLGLPNLVTAPDVEITKDTKDLGFKLSIGTGAPAGQHKTLFCQLVIMQNGEPIVHNLAGCELRIDVPLVVVSPPPKPTGPAVAAKPPTAPPPPEKRLTRLEQLRLEQQLRDKAGTGAGDVKPPAPKK